ncbi:MAG: zinc ribbon domain-containing protein [Thermoplasmata archaeon]
MKLRLLLVLLPFLLLAVPSAAATGASHYTPQAGDGFHYTETILLGDGTGDYSAYTERTSINGTVGVTAVAANGTESASYSNSDSWSNSTGSASSWTSSGTFTFSAATFLYVQGTDNQTGYTNPSVWFYMDNTLGSGGQFVALNTPMTVESTDANYALGAPLSEDVATIYGEGSGSYERNDVYGVFTATYTWKEYLDPSTGYVVGYVYTEQDSNSSGDGFAITDALYVTSTTYPLTLANAPAAGSGSTFPFLLVGVIVGAVVIILLVVWVVVRSRRGPSLPPHSAGGEVHYGPPPGAPPPIHLTPSGEPAVQQIVLRETVKVNCRYCNALIDSTASVCPNCGAPRT